MLAIATLLLSLLAFACGQPILTGYAHSVNLTNGLSDGSNRVASYYVLYYTVAGSSIHLGIVADTGYPTGWAAFGISTDTGAMVGSDAVIGWNDAQGVALAEDFTLKNTFPPNTPCVGVCPDSSQSGCSNQVTAVSGRRDGNYLVVEYTRPLAASDTCDNAIVLDQPTNVVYSVGAVAGSATWPYNPRQHILRTDTVGVDLLNVITFTASVATTGAQPTEATTTGGASGTTGSVTGTTGAHVTTGVTPATTGASDSSSEVFVFSLTGLLIALMMTFGV